MAHQSFAKTVLGAMKATSELKGISEVDVTTLSCALHLQTRKDHKRMLNTLSDLARSGKITRVRQGVYSINTAPRKPDKREVMWRTLRMRRVVTIADLQELAGVSHDYAKEWLSMLVKRKIALRVDPKDLTKPRSWRLIKYDLQEMPLDTEKAAKLRNLRKKKKQQILNTLDKIGNELSKVRDTIANFEDE